MPITCIDRTADDFPYVAQRDESLQPPILASTASLNWFAEPHLHRFRLEIRHASYNIRGVQLILNDVIPHAMVLGGTHGATSYYYYDRVLGGPGLRVPVPLRNACASEYSYRFGFISRAGKSPA